MAAPTDGSVQPRVIHQTTVIQNGGVRPIGVRANPYYDNMNKNERNMRTCSVLFGVFTMLCIVVALVMDELSDGETYSNPSIVYIYANWDCGFTKVSADYIGFNVYSYDYGELCNSGTDGIGIEEACKAEVGGTGALVCSLMALMISLIGIICVQPKCEVKRYGTKHMPRIIFGVALLLLILAPIIWSANGKQFCQSSEWFDMKTGGSIYFLIVACVCAFISLVLAK